MEIIHGDILKTVSHLLSKIQHHLAPSLCGPPADTGWWQSWDHTTLHSPWEMDHSLPSTCIGLSSPSFRWYPRLARWPRWAALSCRLLSGAREALHSAVFLGLVHCPAHRRQCTITEWIKEWPDEPSTSNGSYKIKQGKLTIEQENGKGNVMDELCPPPFLQWSPNPKSECIWR